MDRQQVLIRDLDRLTLSVHYASTPALAEDGGGHAAGGGKANKAKANSIEENSVNSEDCEVSSSSSSSDHHHHHHYHHGQQHLRKQQQQQQQQQQHYLPSNHSIISSSHTNSSLESSSSGGVVLRNKRGGGVGLSLPQNARTASVSTSRLSSIVLNRNSQDLSKFQIAPIPSVPPEPIMVPQPKISTPNFPPPPPPISQPEQEQQQEQQQIQQEQKSPADLRVTDDDVRAIDSCYRGHKTRVFVCGSLANLYTCPRAPSASAVAPDDSDVAEWTLRLTGIPILLLDAGQTKPRLRRRIQLVLAEKGTCFSLWSDVVDNLSRYEPRGEAFHVMRLSRDHLRRIGLSFDCPAAAEEFMGCLRMLTSDPANISLSGPGAASGKARKLQRQREKEEEESARRWRPPNKSTISQPCGFQHVVRVAKEDKEKFFSLQAFVEGRQNGRRSDSVGGGSGFEPLTLQRQYSHRMHNQQGFKSCGELNC